MGAVNLDLDAETVTYIINALRDENTRLTQAIEKEREKSVSKLASTSGPRGKVSDPQQTFYTALDLAQEYGTSAQKVFLELADMGIIKYDLKNKEEHHRPHQEFFEKGWFWRIERHSFSAKESYFQTVFTTEGYRAIRKLLSERLTSPSDENRKT